MGGGSPDAAALDASTPAAVVSLDGRFLSLNQAFADVVGLDRDQLMRLGPLAVTHPADRDRVVAMLGLMRAGSIGETKFRHRWLPLGEEPVEALLEGAVIHGDDGAPAAFAFTLETLSSLDRQSEWESLFAHSRQGIALIGPDGRHERVNDAYAALLGCASSDLLGVPWLEIVPADGAPELERAWAEMLGRGSAWLATLGLRRDGACFEAEIELVVNEGHDGSPSGHVCLMRTAGSRGEQVERSTGAERRDGLTGLPDLTLFAERLERRLAGPGSRSLSVLVLGVEAEWKAPDGGERAGSGRWGGSRRVDLLRAIANRLESELGSDGFVARLGDRSFGILLATRDELTIAARTRCLLKAISGPFGVAGEEHHVHATVGVAIGNRGDGARELIDAANRARQRARELGSDRFELSELGAPPPGSPVPQLADEVRDAVRRDELRLRYQPVFDMSTQSIRGVEVLVRWEHPSRTVLPPDVFLPAARRAGEIVAIGRWVLEHSLRQLESWNQELAREEPLRLFVNLSAPELADASLVDSVATALEQTSIRPQQLTVEVSDAALIDGQGQAWRSVAGLRDLGALVLVDQFGTAFSSLADLERLPVDMVKLDRSCVAGVADDARDRAIAKAAVAVAEASHLTVLACGVETERQANALVALGCNTAQGFLFAEPRAGRAVTKLLRWNGGREHRHAS